MDLSSTLPVHRFETLYHVGTLCRADRGRQGDSQEGHLLSVSICPQAWRQIARLGGAPLQRLDKPGGAELLDAIALWGDDTLRASVEAWAVKAGLLVRRNLWRAWHTNEAGEYRFSIHASQAIAANEADDGCDGPEGKGSTEMVEVMTGTPALAALVEQRDLGCDDAFDYAAMVWAERTCPQLDGLYWDARYDPHALSAPRGGIFPGKLVQFEATRIDWTMAPDERSLEGADEVPPQVGVTLPGGIELVISQRLAHDGYYNEVIDVDPDGSGQKVLKLVASVDGRVVASACAAYLDERRGGHLAVLNVHVDGQWRRRGVARALYDAVQSHYGDQVLPYPGNEGGAIRDFWRERLKDEPALLEQYAENIGGPARRAKSHTSSL